MNDGNNEIWVLIKTTVETLHHVYVVYHILKKPMQLWEVKYTFKKYI